MAKNSSPSGAPKNWRSTPGEPGGARKNGQKGRKTPSNRLAAINTAIKLMMKYCPDFQCEPARGSPKTPSRRKYEILPKARRLTHDCQIQARRINPNFTCEPFSRRKYGNSSKARHLSLHIYRHVNNLPDQHENCTCRRNNGHISTLSKTGRQDEPEQQGHRPRRSTATAGPAQFSDIWTKAAVVAQRRAWQRQCRCSTAQLWELDCLLHDCTEYCTTCKPKYRSPCQCTATEESLCFEKEGP